MPERTNSTRLKENFFFPTCKHKIIHEIVLMFKDNVRERLLEAKKRDYERDAVILMRVANIIRNKIFKSTHYRFTGQLTDE